MRAVDYLPTKQFTLIVGSLLCSGGLVLAAQAYTNPNFVEGTLTVSETDTSSEKQAGDWKSALAAVQADAGIALPPAPDQTTVEGLLKAVQSSNLTDTVSRSLFINLTNAKGQGLGDDIPTQEQLIKKALAQVPSPQGAANVYTQADLTVVGSSQSELRAYGNATMAVFTKDSDQEYSKTLVIIDAAIAQEDESKLALLPPIQKKYKKIEAELAAIPVPKTLAPFHLQLLNDYASIAATYNGLGTLLSDPLGGLAAVQQYMSLTKDASSMFINIAQSLDKNAILFTKDEPGATWIQLLQQ